MKLTITLVFFLLFIDFKMVLLWTNQQYVTKPLGKKPLSKSLYQQLVKPPSFSEVG